MKPKNHPGRVARRRARAEARAAGLTCANFVGEDVGVRFRVGRAHRNEKGEIVGTPQNFPKSHYAGDHPREGSRPRQCYQGGRAHSRSKCSHPEWSSDAE